MYGFGTSKRGQEGTKSLTKLPGPGAYDLGGLTGKDGPAASIHNKLSYKPIEKSAGLTPGPGAYESHTNNKARDPSWGTGTSKRTGDVNKQAAANPAPGAYSPQTGFVMKGDPKFGFGSEKRPGPVDGKKSGPGPGNYSLDPMAFDAKRTRFHLGQKLPELKPTTQVPGAGAYDPRPEAGLPALPSFSMKSKLGGGGLASRNNIPGPGSYDSNLNDKQSS